MARSFAVSDLIEILRSRAATEGTSYLVQRERSEAAVSNVALPPGVIATPSVLAGLRAEWLDPVDGGQVRTILHLHGGGYVLGSLNTVRPLASNLALHARARVVTIDYRLAPEHPFPTAVDDAVRAFEALLALGVDPPGLVLSGDSAGGGLAVAALITLRDRGLPLPAAAVCISPWSDLSLRESATSLRANAASDPLVSHWMLEQMAELYAGAVDRTAPLVSPMYADLSGLPPMLVHVGESEGLRDDGCALAAAAERAGVAVTLERWPEMFHVWHAFAPGLVEATAALESVGTWLDKLGITDTSC